MPHANELMLDFETFYSSDYSVKELGNYNYTRHEQFDPYLISVCDGSESWCGHTRDFNFEALRDRDLLAWNAAFDEEVLLAAQEKGIFPKIPYRSFTCSANLCAYVFNVRSLKEGVTIGLGEVLEKDVRDRAKGKTWDDMVREGWSQDMINYGLRDSVKAWQFWEKYEAQWPAHERRLSKLTIDQGRYGVYIDRQALETGIETLQRVILAAQANLPWVARGKKPASPIGVAEECRAAGIPQPPLKSGPDGDQEEYDEWEEEYAPRFKWVLALRSLRKANKMLATFETVKSRIRADGTASFSLLYFGAHTGRWSGAGGWNLQNPNKEPLFISTDYEILLDRKKIKPALEAFEKGLPLPEGVLTFVDLRGLISARPGNILIPVDSSQIEPRSLAYLAGNWEFLELVRQGMSPYEAHARRSMEWTGGVLKDEDKKKYAYAKERVLSLGYGAGFEKFAKRAIVNGIDILADDEKVATEEAFDHRIQVDPLTGTRFIQVLNPYWRPTDGDAKRFKKLKVWGMNARRVVQDYRTKEVQTVALWKFFNDEIKRSAETGEDLVVELPSGRRMIYREVRRMRIREKDEEQNGEIVERTVYTARIGNRRRKIYGALIVENITQAFARDVFAEKMLEIEDSYSVAPATHPVCLFSAHDEAVPELPIGLATAKDLERIMSQTPTWCPGLPLAAEAKETQKYLK